MFADTYCKLNETQAISHMNFTRNLPLCILLRALLVPSANVVPDIWPQNVSHRGQQQLPYFFYNVKLYCSLFKAVVING